MTHKKTPEEQNGELYAALQPKWEELKQRYPAELNINGLEPALLADITELVSWYLTVNNTALVKEIEGRLNKARRTDETQMSHDHAYDEALDVAVAIIKEVMQSNDKV